MSVTKISDIKNLLKSGSKLVVEFGPKILDAEDYPEPGMRAVAIAYTQTGIDMAYITFDFAAFDEHNKALESRNYYDSKGIPRLTAREAGCYTEIYGIYFTLTDELDLWFKLISSDSVGLYAQYAAEVSAVKPSYVNWLEQKVLSMQPSLKD